MPALREIQSVAEGFAVTVTDGTVVTLNKAALPANLKSGTPAQLEAWFATNVAPVMLAHGIQVSVHVVSNPPLVMSLVCADVSVTIGANWWNK
jgi:hypothetical protein